MQRFSRFSCITSYLISDTKIHPFYTPSAITSHNHKSLKALPVTRTNLFVQDLPSWDWSEIVEIDCLLTRLVVFAFVFARQGAPEVAVDQIARAEHKDRFVGIALVVPVVDPSPAADCSAMFDPVEMAVEVVVVGRAGSSLVVGLPAIEVAELVVDPDAQDLPNPGVDLTAIADIDLAVEAVPRLVVDWIAIGDFELVDKAAGFDSNLAAASQIVSVAPLNIGYLILPWFVESYCFLARTFWRC